MAEENSNPVDEGSVDDTSANDVVKNVISPLDIPDPEFDAYIRDNMNIINSELPEDENKDDTLDRSDDSTEDDSTNINDDTNTSSSEDNKSDNGTKGTESNTNDSNTSDSDSTNQDKFADATSNKSVDDTKEDKSDKSEDKSSIDFEAEHKKLLAPFRANNRDITVKDVEQARTLMQMGANYNKKMAGIKPYLKMVKMLENNDLLDENKLSFLIDLDKKNPDAITKLLKDSKIDVDLIDTKKEIEYKPSTYTVDDSEVEINLALKDIEDSPSFNETVEIIGNKWDPASKRAINDNPGLIKVINDHVETGIYKTISDAVDHKRMLGELNNISDLDAYRMVGEELQKSGAFNPQDTNNSSNTKDVSTTKAKSDNSRQSRKKAASSTKGTPTAKNAGSFDYNPLSLSDDEFDKLAKSINL